MAARTKAKGKRVEREVVALAEQPHGRITAAWYEPLHWGGAFQITCFPWSERTTEAAEPPRLNIPDPVRFIDCPKCHARMPARDLAHHQVRSCPFAPLSDQDRRALMNASTPETRQRDAWKRMVDWERFERGY